MAFVLITVIGLEGGGWCGGETPLLPELGELPITFLSAPVSTIRPPDNVIIESTELSGADAFEEVINLEDVAKLRNPFKDQLEELVKAHNQILPS